MDLIVKKCQDEGIDLRVVYSPHLITYTNEMLSAFENYCSSRNVLFYNYESDTTYTNHPEYFIDFSHLNDKGAKIFTNDIINRLKLRHYIYVQSK